MTQQRDEAAVDGPVAPEAAREWFADHASLPALVDAVREGAHQALDDFLAVPAGSELVPLDEALAAQLDGELEPHALQVFASPADLVRNGSGFAVVVDGRVVAAATSYTQSSRSLEVAIATRPSHRGQGLAAAAAAALLRYCREHSLAPWWSASNPVSQRLALRLGFLPHGECQVLYLR